MALYVWTERASEWYHSIVCRTPRARALCNIPDCHYFAKSLRDRSVVLKSSQTLIFYLSDILAHYLTSKSLCFLMIQQKLLYLHHSLVVLNELMNISCLTW